MMLVNTEYNDQNIDRVYTKMSENFTAQNSNENLSNLEENVGYFHAVNKSENNIDDINLAYDHLYASSNVENGILNIAENCQNAESEVRFLKEWLLIHLDLIQQQNDDILSKEKTIFFLQKENQMLKERISCMERGTPFHIKRHVNNHKSPDFVRKSFPEDMTKDSAPREEDTNDRVSIDLEEVETSCDIDLISYEAKHDIESANINRNNQLSNVKSDSTDLEVTREESNNCEKSIFGSASASEDLENCSKVLKYSTSDLEDSFTEPDSMKNLRMSIRRNRLCSSSSVISNNESSSIDEKRSHRRSRKKKKRCIRDEEILTSVDHYHTQAGDIQLIPPTEKEVAAEVAFMTSNNLEVPHWRVKVYASCYTMEGTENLEDTVYSRRHSRLEVNERRRKRWDVQRIREQRIIEKLKQRQEKGRTTDQSEPIQTLWPQLDDVKCIEFCNHLPVSTLGSPMPKFVANEFSLPWMSSLSLPIKKPKRLRGRRKGKMR